MPAQFGIVDLFAGPGGLGEGFASLADDDNSSPRMAISVECDEAAHRTLRLRAFLRAYKAKHGNGLPEAYLDFHAGKTETEPAWTEVDKDAWEIANRETLLLELGKPKSAGTLNSSLGLVQKQFVETILIGGPPCQAYSLVGRVRKSAEQGYVPEKDQRHYLFREYIRVLDVLHPAAFVMENVKGMLSSKLASGPVFNTLINDLSSLGSACGQLYELFAIRVDLERASLQKPKRYSDFVVRTEAFGIPQRRHRVIIIGVRSDFAGRVAKAGIHVPGRQVTVGQVIGKMPKLRSGVSSHLDCSEYWREQVIEAAELLVGIHAGSQDKDLRDEFAYIANRKRKGPRNRSSKRLHKGYGISSDDLLCWLERPELRAFAQHETRGHMVPDLARYLFASAFAKHRKLSPKAPDFPQQIKPAHRNWNRGVFSDRFRVQLENEASTTVTSHISKDGHYFIHPDPMQCRSLTVREAARLQTFPDDYYFLGNRTQQYVQVGNAVPPFLARQIAKLLLQIFE